MSSTTAAFPLEVLEAVIDFSDSKTVLHWSLTCKALLARARARMLSQITLNNKTCPRVHRLLSDSPDLEKFIQDIVILDVHSLPHGGVGSTTTPLAISVLRQLRHLRTISLLHERYMGCEWTNVDYMMKEVLYECFQLETMQGVDAQFFRHCHSFFERCPRLKHLDLYQPIDSYTRSSPHIARIKLKSLRLAVYADAVQEASLSGVLGKEGNPLFDFSHLERLVVDSCSWHHDRPCTFSSGQWIAGIAPLASSTLRELFWEVSTPDITSETLIFSLHTVPSLETLVVRFNLQNQPIAPADCCRWIDKLMVSRLPLDPIETSTFSLPWDDDPAPICDLIISVQGSRRISLYIDPQPGTYVPGVLSEAEECALQRQPEFQIEVMNPSVSFDSFRFLRMRRPFGHHLATA
ncbi:hypothetical protein DL96DRAFT_907564 [Flagelloscypha sp. PMI_526]|nr:hypothetical protein DL96DRAFT_907564 [Flagelloscypha sp. PMI_526]